METRYRYEMLLNGMKREVERLKVNKREGDDDEDEYDKLGNDKKGFVTILDVCEAAHKILQYNEETTSEGFRYV